MSSSIRKKISIGFIVVMLITASLGFGMTAKAETNSTQLTQIQTLLKLIEQLQAQLAQMKGGTTNVGQCIQLSRSLFLGSSDSDTGGEVSKLQLFLTKTGHYTYGEPTGYFGPATQMAVQAWQKANGVVSSGSPETTGYGVTGPSTRSAMAKLCSSLTKTPIVNTPKVEKEVVEEEEEEMEDEEAEKEDPNITLTSPKRSAVFNKNEANDDVVFKWTAEDVPENSNVLYEVISVESYAGAFVTGVTGQIKAKSGSYEHRIAIDIPGTLGAGEYKVRLSLQECHSLGCNVSYTSGPLKENLETYDTSSYGYFTIIETGSASVDLVAAGQQDDGEIDAEITQNLDFSYYPTGDIDECVVTGKYSIGSESVEHPWPNTILSGQYGVASFAVVSSYPKILLEEVEVECTDDNNNVVANDSIKINVDNDEESDYSITLNNNFLESGTGISEAETRSRCLKVFNDNSGQRVQCSWDGDEFFDETNWKG